MPYTSNAEHHTWHLSTCALSYRLYQLTVRDILRSQILWHDLVCVLLAHTKRNGSAPVTATQRPHRVNYRHGVALALLTHQLPCMQRLGEAQAEVSAMV